MIDLPNEPADIKPIAEETVEVKKPIAKVIFAKGSIFPCIALGAITPIQSYSLDQYVYTEQDLKKIHYIMRTTGEKSKVSLLKYMKKLQRTGDELRSYHSLKFIQTVMLDPSLKKQMINILNDTFKRVNFMRDLSRNLNEWMDHNQMYIYLDEFAASLNVPSAKIKQYFDQRDWTGMVKYLSNR